MFEGLAEQPPVVPPQQENKPQSVSKAYKLLFIVLLASIFLIWRFVRTDFHMTECISDKLHYALQPINSAMHQTNFIRVLLTGIGQFIIDSWFLFLITFWTIFVRNSRFPISVGMFYLIRGQFLVLLPLTQNIELFPFPKDIIWHDPGFFSLTVPYDHTRDFFYSGHTGILVIAFCQLLTLGMKKSSLVCSVCICYIIILLLSTQVHYTTDVFAGFIMGLYIHGLVGQYVIIFDWLGTAPFKLAKGAYRKIRSRLS